MLIWMYGLSESSCKPEGQRYILFSWPTLATFRGLAHEFLAPVVSDFAERREIFRLVKIKGISIVPAGCQNSGQVKCILVREGKRGASRIVGIPNRIELLRAVGSYCCETARGVRCIDASWKVKCDWKLTRSFHWMSFVKTRLQMTFDLMSELTQAN